MQDLSRVLVAPIHPGGRLPVGNEPAPHQGNEANLAAAAGQRALRLCGTALLCAGLSIGAIGQAAAVVVSCPHPGSVPNSEIYQPGDNAPSGQLNGSETFPGTNVGAIAVGNICQIGVALSNPTPGNASVAEINPAFNPSNYEFSWSGGLLDIDEKIGPEGTTPSSIGPVNVELYSWNGTSATLVPNTSVQIPATTTADGPEVLVFGGNLSAGNYTISTFCGDTGCISTGGAVVDPQFQVNFFVPEPDSLALLGVSLLGLGALARRRRARTA